MKFSEMPYTRPDLAAFQQQGKSTVERITAAHSAQDVIDAYTNFDNLSKAVSTNTSLAYVRHTIDTKDAFYDAEQNYIDEIEPSIRAIAQEVDQALLSSPFRSELE